MSRGTACRIDRVFPEIGRLNVVSGAHTRGDHEARNALVTKLYRLGMLDHLRAVKRGELTVTELYHDDMTGKLAFSLERTTLRRPLWPMVEAWIPTSAAAPGSRRRYDSAFKFLRRTTVLSETAMVGDLGELDWRALCNRGLIGPTGWNRLRSAVSSFLTAALRDRWHEFRRRVVSRFPKLEEAERVADVSVAEFWRILGHVRAELRPAYVTIAAAGLGPGEFCRSRAEDLLPHTGGLVVHGTKQGRKGDVIVRLAPEAFAWARQAIPCPVGTSFLSHSWKKACRAAGRGEVRLYDLRHCTAQWLTDAGRSLDQVQQTMRHKSLAMTARYARRKAGADNATVLGTVMFPAAPSRDPSRDAAQAVPARTA